MARKRKRHAERSRASTIKRQKLQPQHEAERLDCSNGETSVGAISHPLLSLYYPRVVTLRQYLVSALPRSSKGRKRRIASLCHEVDNKLKPKFENKRLPDTQHRDLDEEDRQVLARLLDETLVGQTGVSGDEEKASQRLLELETFSQAIASTAGPSTVGSTAGSRTSSLSEVRIVELMLP
jgi:telomerase reverse transcriptase